MSDITKISALELSGKIKNNELSVIEVVNEQLKVIKKREPIYNSYITVMEDEAREQAKLVQEKIRFRGFNTILPWPECLWQ